MQCPIDELEKFREKKGYVSFPIAAMVLTIET